ncbi:MAG: polysulfide reductase NrfD [Nitrososphaerota archaeon]|nr:polysulfide reductase NrfD [Nitrososphaerota archaeon]
MKSEGPTKTTHLRFYSLVAVLLAVVALGAYAWILELQYGLAVTDMRDVVSWGLYISLFAWFVGISAGGLIVSSASAVFRIQQWQPIAKLANLIASVAIALAAFSIIPDLGQPGRILNLFVYPNLTSPLIWDITIIGTYLFISLLELGLLFSADRAKGRGDETKYLSRERVVRGVSFVALPVAVLTHSITAWIFGLQISRPLWNTALLAPLFIASAIVSGLALVIFVSVLANKYANLGVDRTVITGLARLLSVVILVDLFLLTSEYITAVWPATPAEISPLVVEFFGPYGWLAWTQWVFAIAAFAILVVPRWSRSSAAQFGASVLLLLEVFFYRLELIIPGFVNPLVQYPPGTSVGTTTGGVSLSGIGVAVSNVNPSSPGFSFQLVGAYFPTWIEWSISIGIVAMAALLITLGVRYLPVRPAETGQMSVPTTPDASATIIHRRPPSLDDPEV